MSSHREAPEISKDPVADSTDVYAFVSPDRPDTVTLITNYIPLEDPAGGPNFFEFGDDVLYRINIDNDNDGKPELIYEFEFSTRNQNPASFLYNTGPIDRLDSPNFNPATNQSRGEWSLRATVSTRGVSLVNGQLVFPVDGQLFSPVAAIFPPHVWPVDSPVRVWTVCRVSGRASPPCRRRLGRGGRTRPWSRPGGRGA